MKFFLILTLIALTPFCLQGCSSQNDIFPKVSTSLTDPEFPNPIAIAIDAANGQIILVNSNVDVFFDGGSLATISVDATDTNAPVLQVTSITVVPSYAGNVAFDGTSAYIPFREGIDEDSDIDQLIKYTVGAGSISAAATSTTGSEPFGIALNGGSVFVVSDRELNIFDTDLNATATVDLETASVAAIADSSSRYAEDIAIDTVNNRAFISNRYDKVLVVDLDNNTLTHVIDGPLRTRGIAYDGTFIYVVDGFPPALWVFDPSQLTDPASPPEEVDDSVLLVDVIDLGSDPNGIALDVANNRAYVVNSDNRSVSVIDLVLRTEIDRISLKNEDTGLDEAKEPFNLAVGTFNGVPFVFVANVDSNTVSVINANTLKVVASYP